MARRVCRPRDQGRRVEWVLGGCRPFGDGRDGPGFVRAARRRRLGRGPDMVRDRGDAGAHEFCRHARGQSEVRAGDEGEAERANARRVPGVLPQRARHGAARLRGDGGVEQPPARDDGMDGQRCPAPGEGAGVGPPDCGLRGVSVRMKVTRSQFVKGGAAAFPLTFDAPEFLCDLARAQGARVRNLVVLYLGGGNDSLSRVIPYQDSFYYSRRPTLAVPAANVLQIGTDSSNVALGLHPRLTGLKQIFDQGRLALVQRTGYPNQSRSHFTGADIWSTGDPSNAQSLGWVGRYLDSLPSPVDPLIGWNTTGSLPHVLQSARTPVPAIASPAAYAFSSPNSGAEAAAERNAATRIVSHLPASQPE